MFPPQKNAKRNSSTENQKRVFLTETQKTGAGKQKDRDQRTLQKIIKNNKQKQGYTLLV